MQNKEGKEETPKLLIKPVGRLGGLDAIHILLLIAVVILIGLLLVVAHSKAVIIKNVTNTTYQKPVHSAAQVLDAVSRFLASYAYTNTSLSILPYYSEIQNATVTYIAQSKQWLVNIPAINPITNQTFLTSYVVNDSNISEILPLLQMAKPSKVLNNSVEAQGVIKLYGKYACSTASPLQVYWFIDPYAPGNVGSLLNAISLAKEFGKNISIGIKIYNTQATLAIAKEYGLSNAELLGKYIFCASQQANFSYFVNNLNSLFVGGYLSPQALGAIANESKLNYSLLSSCINTSQTIINNQALLAQYYNITFTPAVVVNCEYLTLPQTAKQAICFANQTLCQAK